MDTLSLRAARPDEPGVEALLLRHHALMRSTSPAESCHVMEPGALAEAGAHLIVAEEAGEILGVGAFKNLGDGHGELKSMHTAAEARGRGIARLVLKDLMARAKSAGLSKLSLETGSQPEFAPARALYEAHGFAICPPFGEYVEDPLSVFMTRQI